MEVCRERGNIKLKSRPYTEVSQKQFGNTALHTFQKIVPQKDRFFEVRSQITFATCRTRNFGLWSDEGIMNEQVIELSVPVYKLVLRDCTEKM